MTGHARTVIFNVGGKHYEVSRSLIERFPNTILARMTSELWFGSDKAKDEPIFIERDRERFRYCLDYMRDGRVSVSTTASKDGIVKDLEYYGFEGIDSAAIEVCGISRAATHCVVVDARKNLAEMQLRAVCNKVACDCVDGYLSSGRTDFIIDLYLLEPHFKRASGNDSDYLNKDTWKNKGKDLLNEALAVFDFQTKSIEYKKYGNYKYVLYVTLEGLK